MMRTRWLLVCPVLLALAVAAPAPAAEESRIESPLAQVSAKAPIVLSIRGVKRTTKRLVTMVKNALPDLGPALQTKLADFFNEGLFEGRKLKGLPDDGPIFLVFTKLPQKGDEMPKVAVILRVTDYAAFRDGLLKEDERKGLKKDKAGYEVASLGDKETYFINRKGYAVIAQDQKVAKALAKPVKGKGLAGTLNPRLAKKLLSADIAGYADLTAINETYGKQIKAGFDFLEVALDRLPDAGSLDKGTVEIFKTLAGGLHQAIRDSKSFLLAVEFRPDGFALQTLVDVLEKSKSNAVLKSLKPSTLKDLGTLPANYTTFMGLDFGPDALGALAPLAKKLLATTEEEEDEAAKARNKAVKAAVQQLLDAKPRRILSAGKLGAKTAGLQIWECADPAKAAAGQLKLYKALTGKTQYFSMPLKGKPTIKANAVKYRDGQLHHVAMKWDLDKLGENAGGEQGIKFIKQFMGEGMNAWFGAVGKQYVQVNARDWKTAKRDLDQYFARKNEVGAAKNKAFLRARKRLPAEASALFLVSVPQLAQMLAEVLYEVLKAQGLPVKPPPAPLKKAPVSYLGYSLTLKAGEGSFDLWIPGAAARDFRRAFEPIFKGLSGEEED
jgi:hypothetical protein